MVNPRGFLHAFRVNRRGNLNILPSFRLHDLSLFRCLQQFFIIYFMFINYIMFFHLPLKIINIMHVLFQGLILFLIGLLKSNTPKWLYLILALLSVSIFILVPLPGMKLNYWNMIKWMHYVILAPVLLYISYIGYYSTFSLSSYQMLLWVGLFIMLYHGYKAYTRL